MVTYTAAVQAKDGRWLCNAAEGCQQPAVTQAAYDCTGCEAVLAEHAAGIEQKRQEQAGYVATIEEYRLQVQSEDGPPLTDADKLAALIAQQEVARLGAEIEALEAAHKTVEADHTHPVFACATHAETIG